jgi:hypothetical protein
MNRLLTAIRDLKNGTSHSVEYLLDDDVGKILSEKGIKVRRMTAGLLRFAYGFQTGYRRKGKAKF